MQPQTQGAYMTKLASKVSDIIPGKDHIEKVPV